jgi:hypothetical protein
MRPLRAQLEDSYSLIWQPDYLPQIQQQYLVIDCLAHMAVCGSSGSILDQECAPRRCRMAPIHQTFRRPLCVLCRRACCLRARVGEARPALQAVLSRPPLWCDVKRCGRLECYSRSSRIVGVYSKTVGFVEFRRRRMDAIGGSAQP